MSEPTDGRETDWHSVGVEARAKSAEDVGKDGSLNMEPVVVSSFVTFEGSDRESLRVEYSYPVDPDSFALDAARRFREQRGLPPLTYEEVCERFHDVVRSADSPTPSIEWESARVKKMRSFLRRIRFTWLEDIVLWPDPDRLRDFTYYIPNHKAAPTSYDELVGLIGSGEVVRESDRHSSRLLELDQGQGS